MDDQQSLSTEAHLVPREQLTPSLPRNGGDVLVELMRAHDIDVAFGVISIHNLPLVEAVARDLRFVPVRHEAAAVNAADGYARATGKIGVALTSTGTGAGNAAGAMLEALTAQSRVLHITGNINVDLIGEGKGAYHEVPRQLTMLDSVSAHALRITTARQPRAVLAEAVRLLETAPTGPVSVDWPIDLQYTADPAAQNKTEDRQPSPKQPKKADLDAALAVLRAAKRPLIWAGGGARRVGAPLTKLAERWGAGVLTGANGRGSVSEEHPLVVGNFAATDAVAPLLEQADCLLTIGSHLRGNETKNFELALPATHVQIDLDADALGRNYPIVVGLQADAATTVEALLAGLTDEANEPDPGWKAAVAKASRKARKEHGKLIGPDAELSWIMRKRLPARSPIVRDVTIPGSSWGNRLLPIADPTDNLYAAGGGIGQGLAMAIGAGVGRPNDHVLAIIGDGGLQVHLGELATLVAEHPNVVIALFNDGGYGVLRNLQDASGQPRRAVDLHTPDFGRLARAVGLRHAYVATADAFDKALKKALKRTGPTLIELDVTQLGQTPMVPPVDVP